MSSMSFNPAAASQKSLMESLDVRLPENFPGGPETFKEVALFCYGQPLPIDPFNVAALRCAADFLVMNEGASNLREQTDLYINQAVLQSWDDTLIVLQNCLPLLPKAEELLIVSRCVESLAFMSCMEILDPERRTDKPFFKLEDPNRKGGWDCEKMKEISGENLWIKDLIALPFEFFERIIGSMRRQGMKEKYVTPIIVYYANKWVLSEKTRRFCENAAEECGRSNFDNKISAILEGLVALLLDATEKPGGVIPVAFFFALLSRSVIFGLRKDIRRKLEEEASALLHLAQLEDFPTPANLSTTSIEFRVVRRVFSRHISLKTEKDHGRSTNVIIAKLWDSYLSKFAADQTLKHDTFLELIRVVQITDRENHDQMYRAIDIFFLEHPSLSSEEKSSVCRYLDCQKLSTETCVHIVQNELMPLRLVVQALFVQQIQIQKVFKECSDSFRRVKWGGFSESFTSSVYQLSATPGQATEESPCKSTPLFSSSEHREVDLMKKEKTGIRSEFESASFRIEEIEQELKSLKQSLRRSMSKGLESRVAPKVQNSEETKNKKIYVAHRGSCIALMSWGTSQRKYASRMAKVFKGLTYKALAGSTDDSFAIYIVETADGYVKYQKHR